MFFCQGLSEPRLVRKSSIKRASLHASIWQFCVQLTILRPTHNFVWKMRHDVYYSISIVFPGLTRGTHFYEPLVFVLLGFKKKKHFAKKEALRKFLLYSCHFLYGATSSWNPRRKPASANLDSHSATSCTSGSVCVWRWHSKLWRGTWTEAVERLTAEHRASDLETCGAVRDFLPETTATHPPTIEMHKKKSKCIPFTKKKKEKRRTLIWDAPLPKEKRQI